MVRSNYVFIKFGVPKNKQSDFIKATSNHSEKKKIGLIIWLETLNGKMSPEGLRELVKNPTPRIQWEGRKLRAGLKCKFINEVRFLKRPCWKKEGIDTMQVS